MDQDNWRQGNWNAFVVFDCTLNESRKRCRGVPDQFKAMAINHASTYWKLQGHVPPPRKAIRSAPYSPWTMIEITKAHWALGEAHLEGAKWKKAIKFGDQAVGFAAEYAVADWLTSKEIIHDHNPDPRNTDPDFTIFGLTVDLKSVSTKGWPRPKYDANLADRQRLRDVGKVAWYMFGKYDNKTDGDYYILGLQTAQAIMSQGVFYRKGDMTRKKMEAPVDCWCIEYQELIKPLEWIEKYEKR